MNTLCRFVARVLEYAIGGLFIVIAVTAIAQVFTRYVLGDSLTWTHELDILLMIWAVWLGAAIGIHRKAHLRISVLSDLLSVTARKVLVVVIDLFTFIFLVVVGWKGVALLESVEGMLLTSMDVPRGFVVCAAPVGAVLMMFFFLPAFLEDSRNLFALQGKRQKS